MQRRIGSLALALLLALGLCACGGEAPAAPAVPEATAAPAAETAAPAPEPTPEPAPSAAPEAAVVPALPDAGLHAAEEHPAEDAQIAERRALAESFLEKDAAALLDALGEPLERSYALSCLGDGEDGEWVYEGFIVYTYREGEQERVVDVT